VQGRKDDQVVDAAATVDSHEVAIVGRKRSA
jgi:hypothetical protein